MRTRHRLVLLLGALLLAPSPVLAQTGLRDLLTSLLQQGITLAPPDPGFVKSHVAHFISLDQPQFIAIRQFNEALANQLSSFPRASSAGGFTYQFDPSLGVFTRATDSFGPVYADRADTIGKGKFNLGVNYSHFDFQRINDLSLSDGDVKLVFQHVDVGGIYVQGDVITANLFLDLKTDIAAFVMTYGVSDRFDVGAAVPIVRVDLSAHMDATIQRLATGPSDTDFHIHKFTGADPTHRTFQESGHASGVGDIVLRGKFRVLGGKAGGLAVGADVRLPTGEERDLLGTGATEARASLTGSLHLGTFSPHINGGYTWSTNPPDDRTPDERNPADGGTPLPRLTIPDQIDYTVGFDWAVHPRVTVAVDVLGRTFRNTQIVRVENQTFTAVTGDSKGGACECMPEGQQPPQTVTAVFPRLTATPGDSSTLLGSIGIKINPFSNLLVTLNTLFSLKREGLQTRVAPLVGLDYSF
jgi:Putative MetA-pathway of phenol degradation